MSHFRKVVDATERSLQENIATLESKLQGKDREIAKQKKNY